MPPRFRTAAALVAMTLLSVAPAVRADTPGDPLAGAGMAEARAHYQRGVQTYKDGDFKLSLVEFRRAYELSRNVRILYNIARVNEQLGNYVAALSAFESYLRDAGAATSRERRAEVEAEVTDIRGKIATLDVRANVAGAEVLVDGVSQGKTPLAGPLRIDAGDHALDLQKSGYEPVHRTITVASREGARVEVRLEEAAARIVVGAPPSSSPAATARSTPPLVWVGWTATAGLAVGAGITGALTALRAGDLRTLRDSPGSSAEERATAKSRAQTFGLATDILAAAALVVGGTTLYFTLRGSKASDAPPMQVGICGLGLCGERRF